MKSLRLFTRTSLKLSHSSDIIMKNDKEIVGTLQGFDDFVNMLLEDVTESEATPEGRRVTKLDQILLNGSNITMVIIYRCLIIFYNSDIEHFQ